MDKKISKKITTSLLKALKVSTVEKDVRIITMKCLLIIMLSILFIPQICFAGLQAINPDPNDEANGVSIGCILSWGYKTANLPEFANVYIDDILYAVLTEDDQYMDRYDPPKDFDYDITYRWRIDLLDNHGKLWEGDVWSFTTQSCVPELATIILLGFGSLVFVKFR